MTTLITGGTGKTGARVTRILADVGHPTRPVTRHTTPRFDWLDDSTWDEAIQGCDAAYLTFQPDLGLPGADAIIGRFAARAVAAGCSRLVLLSGRGEEGARRAEQALVSSGAAWTILRSAFFMQNFTESFFAEEIAHGSLSMVEHSVGEPFVDADDLAEVAVAVLLDPAFVGTVIELTGPELLTFADVTARYAEVLGRDVVYRALPVDAYVCELVEAGLPHDDAVGLASLFAGVLDGRNAHVDDGVRRVLGREPRTFESFLTAALGGVPHG